MQLLKSILNRCLNHTLLLLFSQCHILLIHPSLYFHQHFRIITKWTTSEFILGWPDLQVALCTKSSITATGDISFGIEHEADGTFTIGFGKARVGAFEPGCELAIGDETTDLFGIPFT